MTLTTLMLAASAALEITVLVRVMLRPHREPASRIAWLAVIISLPLIGMLAYMMFGEVNIGRRRVARMRAVECGIPSATPGAILRGGSGPTAGTLTINNTVTFNSGSTYKCYLNRNTAPKAETVKARGVTINPNVPFAWVETGQAALARGTRFRVIDNTSTNPIFGQFSNLADGSTFIDTHGTTFNWRHGK